MKNKNRVYIVLVILLISIIAGMSYALWQITRTQTDKNIVTTGCFEVTTDLGTEDEQSPISIENAYPIIDSEGKASAPFTFTITNTCDVYAGYQINLETLSATTLNKDYVKVSLNNVGPEILSSFDSVEPTINSATSSNKLLTGGLKAGKSKTFNLRLWMDQDTPMSEGQNKAYQGKISVVTSPSKDPTPVNPCTFDGELVQGAEYSDGTYTYRYMQEGDYSNWSNITEDGWGVKLSDTTATGEINTPLCTSINGKPIVSMAYMYYNAKDLIKIDVSSFDTSAVKNMELMFYYTGYNSSLFEITGIDNWDTSNVKDMQSMFNSAGYNATTWNIGDLSSWDTSNVEDMSHMFYYAGYKTTTFTIDLSGWDTSNVLDMSNMFSSAGNDATTFNIGNLSGWDTSKVVLMEELFAFSGRNASSWNIGNLSNWNVSKVTNMSSMFNNAGYRSDIFNIGDLSSWDISNVTTMSRMFYQTGYYSQTWNNIGILKVYATNIYAMFSGCKNAKATLNIYSNPSSGYVGYDEAFSGSATADGSLITVNYSSATTNIDSIIATKSSNSNVVKGVQLD